MTREPRATEPEKQGETTLPRRRGRRFAAERIFIRVVATAGIVGISVGIGALLANSKVQGWIIGLVVSLVSVILAALLWSSRQL